MLTPFSHLSQNLTEMPGLFMALFETENDSAESESESESESETEFESVESNRVESKTELPQQHTKRA